MRLVEVRLSIQTVPVGAELFPTRHSTVSMGCSKQTSESGCDSFHAVTIGLTVGRMFVELLECAGLQLPFEGHLAKCADHAVRALF